MVVCDLTLDENRYDYPYSVKSAPFRHTVGSGVFDTGGTVFVLRMYTVPAPLKGNATGKPVAPSIFLNATVVAVTWRGKGKGPHQERKWAFYNIGTI